MNDILSQRAQPAPIAVTANAALVSVTITLVHLAGRAFRHYLQQSLLSTPSPDLAYRILKGTILVAGFLIVLQFLSISIAPPLTALVLAGLRTVPSREGTS